jgi:hypothetical protein
MSFDDVNTLLTLGAICVFVGIIGTAAWLLVRNG